MNLEEEGTMPEPSSTKQKRGSLQVVLKTARDFGKMMEQERKLTRLFYKSLEAHYLHIKQSAHDKNARAGQHFEESMTTIANILADRENMCWENAYFVEQLLIPLYDDNTLDVELNRRLVEAQSRLAAPSVSYYEEAVRGVEKTTRRALLKSLVVDLQWSNQIRELMRLYARLTRRNTGLIFIGTVFLFVLSILLLGVFARLFPFGWNPDAIEATGVAMTAGLMGSAFSMLTGMRDRLSKATFDELKVQRRWGFIFTRTIIGLGAALILTYFIQAKLIEGTFFPEFSFDAAGKMKQLDLPNLSLLVVWSFIAGFSEKLVPNIISRAEQKVEVAGTGGTTQVTVKATDASPS